jgi:Alpha-glutamyl/putrescinyl thymine pyrophosphorylase clade 3
VGLRRSQRGDFVRPKDQAEAHRLTTALNSFARQERALPGIRAAQRRTAFLEQLIESIHRVKYIALIRQRDVSSRRADPGDELFDPIKAAILKSRERDHDEACWLTFLSVHFGKNRRSGWQLARDVYGALGRGQPWGWQRISSNVAGFRRWLSANQNRLRQDGVARAFGNHRKYQSLDAKSATGTGAAIATYVAWVRPHRTHAQLFQASSAAVGNDHRRTFDELYRSMTAVASFGRTARFDYLTMIGKLGLAPIEPGSTYMTGATGPLAGARLLFTGNATAAIGPNQLDTWLVDLEAALGMGMQVLEDSLCNWQKCPDRFAPFRG